MQRGIENRETSVVVSINVSPIIGRIISGVVDRVYRARWEPKQGDRVAKETRLTLLACPRENNRSAKPSDYLHDAARIMHGRPELNKSHKLL